MIIFVHGYDVPGIGSAITKALFKHNCNIENLKMTTLNGYFSLIVSVTSDSSIDLPELEETIQYAVSNFAVDVKIARSISSFREFEMEKEEWIPYKAIITCEDQMGVLYNFMREMSRLKINISDVNCIPLEEKPNQRFQVISKIEIPVHLPFETLKKATNALARELDILIDLEPISGLEI